MVTSGDSYLAIDVGSDRLAAGVVNDHGEVLVRDRIAVPSREVWVAVQRLARRVMAARPEAAPLRACSVSCEGPIDKERGTVSPLHLASLTDFELRDRMHELTGLPTVLSTSAQARVVAERWVGAARGVHDVMLLLLGDTVEAGVVSTGRLLGGGAGNAGQIGHLIVEPGGAPCVCGARGCLWAYVSGIALHQELDRPLRRASAAIVERTGLMVGRALASAAAVFDLRLVLLTGSVPAAFGPQFVDAAARELDQRCRVAHLRSMPDRARPLVQIGTAALGREAALIGGAGLARLRLRQAAKEPIASAAAVPPPTPVSGSPTR